GTVATAVAFPQKSESTFPHQQLGKLKLVFLLFLWIRKAALGNSPGDCCNRRGFSAEKRIHLPPSKIDRSRQRFVDFYLFTIHSFAGLCLAFFVRIKYNVHIPTFESKERYS
ncbi:MAG: hypothetical protein Q4C93_01770, partial [Clostridia bacterium]|nr:hypothetical protein [Clostridia bacterium]